MVHFRYNGSEGEGGIMKRLLQGFYEMKDSLIRLLTVGMEAAIVLFAASVWITFLPQSAALLPFSRELCEAGVGACLLTVSKHNIKIS